MILNMEREFFDFIQLTGHNPDTIIIKLHILKYERDECKKLLYIPKYERAILDMNSFTDMKLH